MSVVMNYPNHTAKPEYRQALLKVLHYINHIHLDSMGFAISRMICYEEFNGNPGDRPYGSGSRTLLLPVRPR